MPEYSREKLTGDDFDRLAKITLKILSARGYKPSLLCLCQGAALHYVYEKVKKGEAAGVDAKRVREMVQAVKEDPERGVLGVKDFDVWAFTVDEKKPKWGRGHQGVYARACYDDLRFGEDPTGRCGEGRKIDILRRSINPAVHGKKLVPAVTDWLANSRNTTPGYLREKAAVVIWPANKRGDIIWPR